MWPLKELVMGTAVDSQSNTVFTLFFIHCVCECVSVCLCACVAVLKGTQSPLGDLGHSCTPWLCVWRGLECFETGSL